MRDASRWAQLRRANQEWLGSWEATRPAEATGPSTGYRALTRELVRQARGGRTLPFVLTYDDVVIGQLTVTGITWGSARWAQIGYWLAKSHAGRGIMPTAVALAIDHCFFTMGLHRIEIAIRPENVASLRVVEKLGLAQVGLASRYLHIDGDWRDHLLFAITAEDAPGGMRTRLERPPSPQ